MQNSIRDEVSKPKFKIHQNTFELTKPIMTNNEKIDKMKVKTRKMLQSLLSYVHLRLCMIWYDIMRHRYEKFDFASTSEKKWEKPWKLFIFPVQSFIALVHACESEKSLDVCFGNSVNQFHDWEFGWIAERPTRPRCWSSKWQYCLQAVQSLLRYQQISLIMKYEKYRFYRPMWFVGLDIVVVWMYIKDTWIYRPNIFTSPLSRFFSYKLNKEGFFLFIYLENELRTENPQSRCLIDLTVFMVW